MPEQEMAEKPEENIDQEQENEASADTQIKEVKMKGFKSVQQKTTVPFYEGLTAIVGENGNGKCVSGDTEVVLADGGHEKIGDLVEDAIQEECEEIDDGYVAYGGDEKVLSLNPDTLQTEERNILAYAKREAPEKMFKIRTRSGREIKATADHPLFKLESGDVEATDAEDISKGMKIAVPREIKLENSENKFTELLEEFKHDKELYVPFEEEFEEIIRRKYAEKGLTWKKLAEDINVPYNALRGIKDHQSCRIDYLISILRYCSKTDEQITRLITEVKAKNQNITCKIPWQNSEEFGRLLGYLLAEGQLSKSSSQVRFTNSEEEILDDYEKVASKVLDLETNRESYDKNCDDILIYSTAAQKILEKFGVSKDGSEHKTISDIFTRNSSEEELGALLEGLYAGDGYVSWNAIELTTKSPSLAKGIQAILLRIGVLSRIQIKTKKAVGTGYSGEYHQINVTGLENVENFQKHVEIPHKEKKERVQSLTERESNTNLDLISANGLIQKTVEKMDIAVNSQEMKKKYSSLSAYYYNKCTASREGISKLVQGPFSDTEIEEVEKLRKLANADIYWDEITEIEQYNPEENWVYDLNVAVGHNFIANNIFVHNSNLIDGISFVFGKRSSQLRAKKLQQLIFNGGDSRKPADYAKVTVVLDNSSGIFDEFLEEDEEVNEISVGRKVTQAGSSMYKFQGTNCKASKIQEIARKANIDPDGYHFVRQGKVTEIVKQSPVSRRKVVDELSGVAEFDEKKEEAEEELEEVEDKLQEQEILLDEKKEYLNKLKDDKEQALKHRELDQRKEKIEASILEVRKRAISNQLANLNTDVSDKEDRLEEVEEKLEEVDKKIDEKQDRVEEIEEQMGGNNDIQHLENKIEKKKGQIENKKDKIEDLEDTIESLKKMQSQKNTGSKAVDAVLSLDDERINGVFQDLISYEGRYSVAIDTAAGSRMKNVVVENKNAATDAINYLKRENIGRATMLPMDKIKDKSRSAKSKMAKKKKGVLGYAADLVDYDPKYEKAVNYVFSDTLVAEDLDSVKDVDGVRVVTLDGDIMSRGGAMTGGKKKRKRSKSSSSSKNLDPKKKEKEKEQLEEEIEDLQKDVAELQNMKKEKEKDIGSDEELQNEKSELRDELTDIRDKRQELYSEQQTLKTKIDSEKGKKPKLKAELDNIKEDMEEYDYDEDELTGLDSSPEELKKKKKKIVRKQNRMGPVNMMAIEEYKEKKEEFEEFKDKISEIRQEKLEIEDMIESIEEERRECFMETLEELQESFSKIFTQLFEGGNGELLLEDDDIDQGLEIRAQPPGKEPHIIDALSGGEKTMTAISFVFAILEYQESPFYLMDEIDAALDKTNSKKLSELLKDYAEGNQFIVISHNDITVRHAERAYGVSMRDGVSKIRSIELDA